MNENAATPPMLIVSGGGGCCTNLTAQLTGGSVSSVLVIVFSPLFFLPFALPSFFFLLFQKEEKTKDGRLLRPGSLFIHVHFRVYSQLTGGSVSSVLVRCFLSPFLCVLPSLLADDFPVQDLYVYSTFLHVCSRLFAFIRVYSRLFAHVHVYSRLFAFIHLLSRFPKL